MRAIARERSYIKEGDLLDVDGIDCMGSGDGGGRLTRQRRGGRNPISHPVPLDLYHFLFSSDSASTEEAKATAVVVGRVEEGRQGNHDVRDLGHDHQHGKRDRDAAGCR